MYYGKIILNVDNKKYFALVEFDPASEYKSELTYTCKIFVYMYPDKMPQKNKENLKDKTDYFYCGNFKIPYEFEVGISDLNDKLKVRIGRL